ncbi:hypothetical protein Ade02nite_22950 [Paractinoplanes deccanensis]|uniref:Peptidase M48 domain-containing protein n=2 Tax=Paractinoplanes deccanensis TaxID=113561 RepID=A0ABQ3Y0X1_9ACTN|nr:hypothetical protein Ade02nite_22950 [Actinoplanes deccanensis]
MVAGFLVVAWLQVVAALLAVLLVLDLLPGTVAVQVAVPLAIATAGLLCYATMRALRLRRPSPAGVPVTRERAPKLWTMIDEAAAAAGVAPPDGVTVVASAAATLVERARLGGLVGGHRELYLGLPLFQAWDEARLRAVVAHELAHGSPRLGGRFAPVARRGRVVLSRVVPRIPARSPAGPVLRLWARWYRAVDDPYSRAHELAADRVAAEFAGARVAAAVLRDGPVLEGMQELFHVEYLSPGWQAGLVPDDVFGGFLRVLAARAEDAALLRARGPQEPAEWDPHPPLAERLAALAAITPEGPDPISPPAGDLVPDLPGLGRALQAVAYPVAGRETVSWDEFFGAARTAEMEREADASLRALSHAAGTPVTTIDDVLRLSEDGHLTKLAEFILADLPSPAGPSAPRTPPTNSSPNTPPTNSSPSAPPTGSSRGAPPTNSSPGASPIGSSADYPPAGASTPGAQAAAISPEGTSLASDAERGDASPGEPSLPGGASSRDGAFLPGGATTPHDPSLPGGLAASRDPSLPGGSAASRDPSLPGGSAASRDPSLPGGSAASHDPSLLGGSAASRDPSLLGGSAASRDPSLAGGLAASGGAFPPGGSPPAFGGRLPAEEIAARVTELITLLLALTALHDGRARWRHSWTGAAELVSIDGSHLDLHGPAVLAGDPATVGEAREWLATLGIDITASAGGGGRPAARVPVLGGVVNLLVDGARTDLLVVETGLVLVAGLPRTRHAEAKRRLTRLASDGVLADGSPAHRRLVPTQPGSGASQGGPGTGPARSAAAAAGNGPAVAGAGSGSAARAGSAAGGGSGFVAARAGSAAGAASGSAARAGSAAGGGSGFVAAGADSAAGARSGSAAAGTGSGSAATGAGSGSGPAPGGDGGSVATLPVVDEGVQTRFVPFADVASVVAGRNGRRHWEIGLRDGSRLGVRAALDSEELPGGWAALDEAVSFLTRTRHNG